MADDAIRELPPELQEKWEPVPEEESKTEWVFLHADVIGHSRLFKNSMGWAKLQKNHEALREFRDIVYESIPHFDKAAMEWDWAGDGGIFAFYDSKSKAAKKAVLVAERIRHKLRKKNGSQTDPTLQLEARIVITRGWAYYHPEPSLRCGSALNLAAKLRIPGDRTSIVVTESVIGELQDETLKKQFRPIEPLESMEEQAYVYVPALRDGLKEALDQEALPDGDHVQAAHLAYRLGVLNFGTGERTEAIDAFSRAENLLRHLDDSHRYYHRTLTAFYRLWRELADETVDDQLKSGDGNDRRLFLRKLSKDPVLRLRFGARWQFLHEMEFCIEQLDILARRPVADPTGLTSMQMCLLLERFGYPRQWYGNAVSKRLKRIKDELEASQHASNEGKDAGTMDKGCSLCTAVAASCLILDDGFYVHHLIQWLLSKKNDGFRYRRKHVSSRVKEGEHALHYAASVLQALVDYNANTGSISDVVTVFFDKMVLEDELLDHWVQYLHIPYFDLACYIFSAFARTIIAFEDTRAIGLTELRQRMLGSALNAFAMRLLAEAKIANCEAGRIYAARENLGSFALGLFVGFPGNIDAKTMFIGTRSLIEEVACVDELDPPATRNTTIDSNFDRMWRMLDGWLLQWECALIARERGIDIDPTLEHLFPSV